MRDSRMASKIALVCSILFVGACGGVPDAADSDDSIANESQALTSQSSEQSGASSGQSMQQTSEQATPAQDTSQQSTSEQSAQSNLSDPGENAGDSTETELRRFNLRRDDHGRRSDRDDYGHRGDRDDYGHHGGRGHHGDRDNHGHHGGYGNHHCYWGWCWQTGPWGFNRWGYGYCCN